VTVIGDVARAAEIAVVDLETAAPADPEGPVVAAGRVAAEASSATIVLVATATAAKRVERCRAVELAGP
jgi:hypothetical protein